MKGGFSIPPKEALERVKGGIRVKLQTKSPDLAMGLLRFRMGKIIQIYRKREILQIIHILYGITHYDKTIIG